MTTPKAAQILKPGDAEGGAIPRDNHSVSGFH